MNEFVNYLPQDIIEITCRYLRDLPYGLTARCADLHSGFINSTKKRKGDNGTKRASCETW